MPVGAPAGPEETATDPDPAQPPAASPAPSPSRWGVGRWLLVSLGVIGACAAGLYWNAQREAKETIARHRARYEDECKALAAGVRRRPAILQPSAAGTAEDVRAAFLAAVAAVPAEERAKVDAPIGDPAPEPETVDEQARVLDAHPDVLAPVLPLLHVQSRPTLPDVHMEADARAEAFQGAARWLIASSHRAIVAGRREEGLRLAALGCALGADFARSGPLVCWLAGSGIETAALDLVREVLAGGRVAPDEAGGFARVLDSLDAARRPLADALDFERAAFRGSWARVGETGDATVKTGWRHFWSLRVFIASFLDSWDGAADRMREIAILGETDPVKARADAKRLDDAQEEVSLVRIMTVLLPMIVRRDAEDRATRRVARTAIAIAAYRAEKGALPATLAELVPAFLPNVPIDPWDGRPLRWSAGEKGTVWSIGRDGKDDGGIPCGEMGRNREVGDVSWTLWNGR